MSYAAEHADALAAVKDAGQAVTFAPVGGAFTPSTGAIGASAAASVSGYAMQTPARTMARTYAALGLIESVAPCLFFVASRYGDFLDGLAYAVTFGGISYAVKDAEHYRPDGVVIFSRIVITR